MAEGKKEPPSPIEYPKVKVKFKDLFNFSELYGIMHAWLKDNEWVDKTSGENLDYMEEFFLEKTGPTGAKDHIIYWEAEKIASDYVKYSMSIVIGTTFLNQTEVMKDGKKVKTNIGDVKVEITVRFHPDYKGEWTNHWLFSPFRTKLEETMFKDELGGLHEKLYKQLYEFQAEIKRYLKLQQFMSPASDFMPEKPV